MEKKMKELNPDDMNKVSGGRGTVNAIFGDVCIWECGAEARDTGRTAGNERFAVFRCENGHEFTVYVG